jgi:two-component system, NtrC family, response regulator AtoC
MASRRILIIDDEPGVRTSLSLILEDEGHAPQSAGSAEPALQLLRESRFDVVLCDVRMPGRDGLSLLPEIVALQPEATVLVMSAHGDVDQALAAVRAGAWDYLAKPFAPEELLLTICKAEERERLRRENQLLRRELRTRRGRGRLVRSEAMRALEPLLEGASEFKTTVLITGESGVGKEVAAREIHARSERASRPFIAVNCGAIPEALIESELFGHARGAFTGASSDAPGMFREADGGTLFLDEIGELPLATQVALLRALQEEEVRPVGEAKSVAVDVRIIAATSRDLEAMVERGEFRADLYYRLNVLRIALPPLRERPGDIALLAAEILEGLCERLGRRAEPLDASLLELLRSQSWPGNVRELENALERALILSRGGRLGPEHFAFVATRTTQADPARPAEDPDLSIKRQLRQLEERLIRRALAATAGNRTQASRLLELSARALQYKLKEYAIDPLNPLPRDSDSSG